MAELGKHEKEYASTDPVGAAHDTNTSEPVATEPLQYVGSESDLSFSDQEKKRPRPEINRTLTTTSSLTVDSRTTEPRKKKPWYKRLNPLKRSSKPPVPKNRIISREYGARFLSMLTFQWMAPLMSTGYQRPLELNDIWLVNPNRAAPVLSSKLGASFRRRLERGDKYPLVWALHETFRFEFWLGGICQLLASIVQVMSPFTLRYLISFATAAYTAQHSGKPSPHIANGIGLVIGITGMQMLQSLSTNHFIYRGQIVGAQSRGVLITAIFEKAMKISGRAKAGGKAIEDMNKPDEHSNTKIEGKGDRFFTRMINKKLQPKGGPQVTPDKAQGISGDGAGWGNGRVVNLMSTVSNLSWFKDLPSFLTILSRTHTE